MVLMVYNADLYCGITLFIKLYYIIIIIIIIIIIKKKKKKKKKQLLKAKYNYYQGPRSRGGRPGGHVPPPQYF